MLQGPVPVNVRPATEKTLPGRPVPRSYRDCPQGGSVIVCEREYGTLLAALRAWMNELGWHSIDELQAACTDLGAAPLTVAEVEVLTLLLEGFAR
jgi:hypothetical protein